MSKPAVSGFLLAALLLLTLPVFYLVFTHVILPSLWQEDELENVSSPTVQTAPDSDTAPDGG